MNCHVLNYIGFIWFGQWNYSISTDSDCYPVGADLCVRPLPRMGTMFRTQYVMVLFTILCFVSNSNTKIRTDTEVCPYLANNGHVMRWIGCD